MLIFSKKKYLQTVFLFSLKKFFPLLEKTDYLPKNCLPSVPQFRLSFLSQIKMRVSCSNFLLLVSCSKLLNFFQFSLKKFCPLLEKTDYLPKNCLPSVPQFRLSFLSQIKMRVSCSNFLLLVSCSKLLKFFKLL